MSTWGQLRFQLQKFSPGVDLDLVDQWLNSRYTAVLNYHPWRRLEKDGVLQTTAIYNTGTISLTAGSTAVTGSGTTFPAANALARIRPGTQSEFYGFTQTGATTGTLDRPYEGATNASLAYYIFQSIYKLPSDLKTLLELNNLRLPFPMRNWSQYELNQIYPNRPGPAGEPKYYSPEQDSSDATPLYQVELYPFPLSAAGYPLRYQMIAPAFDPTITTASPLPWISDHSVLNGVKADIRAYLKDYDGALAFEKLHAAALEEMVRVDLFMQPYSKRVEAGRFMQPSAGAPAEQK